MPDVNPFVELDTSVSENAISWQRKARVFARDHAAPTGRALDVMSPADAVAEGSPYFAHMRRARAAGFLTMTGPAEYGAQGLTRQEEYLVLEELATGDAGLAMNLFIAPLVFQFAYNFGGPQLVEELCRPFYSGEQPDWLGCFAITDANHGSDAIAAHTPTLTVPGGDLAARKVDGGWVLDGQKSAWISGAATSTHALVCCAIDPTSLARSGVAIVRLDQDGVLVGAPQDKLGLRSANQASISFDATFVPDSHMIIGADAYAMAFRVTHTLASVSIALLAFGVGRAAYEGAVRFAHERVQGGKPLIEHQATQLRIFRMFTLLESARSLTRAVYTYNYGRTDVGAEGSLAHSCASKVFVTDSVFEVCDIASQICGARGMQREGIQFTDGSVFYPEKLLRDAKAFKTADNENTMLSLIGAANLSYPFLPSP